MQYLVIGMNNSGFLPSGHIKVVMLIGWFWQRGLKGFCARLCGATKSVKNKPFPNK